MEVFLWRSEFLVPKVNHFFVNCSRTIKLCRDKCVKDSPQRRSFFNVKREPLCYEISLSGASSRQCRIVGNSNNQTVFFFQTVEFFTACSIP